MARDNPKPEDGWSDGVCPVHATGRVQAEFRIVGSRVSAAIACNWQQSDLSSDIIAYRVVRP